MNRIKILLATLLTTFLCVSQALAAEIPAEFIGEGKWVTLKTENGYYFYAIEEGGQIKLGQTKTAPTSENYAAYCWQINGDATNGYTFCCLKYENSDGSETPAANKRYITNPETVEVAYNEVRLTNNPSRYYYTDKHQFQLVDNQLLYLAFYSSSWHTIRLHNSPDYVGSKMVIGGIFDWSVAAVVYGTETEDGEGHPQGTYLPGGGITYSGTKYFHGSNLHLSEPSGLTIIPLEGYTKSTIKIDHENHYIVAYYVGTQSGLSYENAPGENADGNVVKGKSGTIWTLNAQNYITNTGGSYTSVPAGKAWQMTMVVENTKASGNDPSFNQWGSCILSSCGDPFNTYYWGDFQIYQHAPTHSRPNTLNFKSSKADGNDHIIAQGHSVANTSYKVIVRYNGSGVYLIRTIMLDESLEETNNVYNNVWISAQNQNVINQMSCAIPTGINIKRLEISIAEECGLLEGVDYAIQNVGNNHYISFGDDASFQNWRTADHASMFQIEYTNSVDLAYHGEGGSLHKTFYLIVDVWDTQNYCIARKYIGPKDSNGKWTLLDYGLANKASAQPFLYSQSTKMIQAITDHTVSASWTIGESNQWNFDFFATFQIDVRKNNSVVTGSDVSGFGGFVYKQTDTHHGGFMSFPATAATVAYPNISQLGYSAQVTKDATMLRVNYTPLEDTFYNIYPLSETTGEKLSAVLYYWYKNRQVNDIVAPSLIAYGITNSQSGEARTWGDKGDCSKFNIEKATQIPVNMNAADGKYYGTIYCPNALTLPDGVKAYRLDQVLANGNYLLKPIDGNVLPANVAAVLISEANLQNNPSGDWAINVNGASGIGNNINLFSGVFEQTSNPGSGQETNSNIFVLGNKTEGVGFYPYSGAKIPAFKAYHQVTAGDAKMFTFTFDDDITGITDIEKQPVEANDRYYDLSGRQITTPVRGHIYIHNGVKVLYK